jgi:hypothetical protein
MQAISIALTTTIDEFATHTRGWTSVDYVNRVISGLKDRRSTAMAPAGSTMVVDHRSAFASFCTTS